MPELRSRPLTASDEAVYVPRPADDLIRQAVNARENVLLGAVRGAGATSLLYRLEQDLPDVTYVNAPQAGPSEILTSVASRLGVSRSLVPDLGAIARPDPLATPPLLQQLRVTLAQDDRHPVVLLDGPVDSDVAFQLFGQWRDELFAVPVTWVVVAHHDQLASYLTPPADVFFDVVLNLEGFSPDRALELLARRQAWEALPPDTRRAVIESFDGTPRHLLRLVRTHLAMTGEDDFQRAREHAMATAQLSRGTHMLLAEMQGRGPVSATDSDLRSRLGVTDRQLRRNFNELSAAGLVEVVPGNRGSSGRPPITFKLTDLGQIPSGAV